MFASPPLETLAARSRHIFAVMFRLLGDCVLATPSLDALKQHNPDVKITALVVDRFAPLFVGHPSIDELVVVPWRPRTREKWRIIRELRRRPFDAAINFHGNRTSGAYTWGGNCPRVGLADFALPRLFYSHRVDARAQWPDRQVSATAPLPPLHKVEYRFSLVRAMGVPGSPGPLTVPIADDARESIAAKLAADDLAHAPFVVMHVAAAQPPKIWPAEHFAAVCWHLRRAHDLPVIVTTGPGESPLIAGLMAELGREPLAAREWLRHYANLSLPELAALLSRAYLYVGTDSGPTHIAAAVGCPSVVVYGPTEPAIWHPWRVPFRAVSIPKACRPCKFVRECPLGEGPTPSCIAGVTADAVQRACDELMAHLAAIRE